MTDQTAYVSTHPDVLAALHANQAARDAYADHLTSQAAHLPGYVTLRALNSLGTYTPCGVEFQDPTNLPPGWAWKAKWECAVPARGKAGNTAREWLDSVKATVPKDCKVLEKVGAPANVNTPNRGGRGDYLIQSARVLVTPDAVHVLYEAEPTDDNTGMWTNHKGTPDGRWEREPLSAYYTALEAAEASREAQKAGAR